MAGAVKTQSRREEQDKAAAEARNQSRYKEEEKPAVILRSQAFDAEEGAFSGTDTKKPESIKNLKLAPKINNQKLMKLPLEVQHMIASLNSLEIKTLKASLAQYPEFEFLQLPGEVRNRIYELVIVPTSGTIARETRSDYLPRFDRYEKRKGVVPSVLLVSRQVHQEAIHIFRRDTMLHLEFVKRNVAGFRIQPRDRVPILTFQRLHFTIVWFSYDINCNASPDGHGDLKTKFQTPVSLITNIMRLIKAAREGNGNAAGQAPVSLRVDFLWPLHSRRVMDTFTEESRYKLRAAIYDIRAFTSAFKAHVKLTSNVDSLLDSLDE